MTCFARMIDLMGLTAEHQNRYGHMLLLLKMADHYEAAGPTADTYPTNPYREVLHRLRTMGCARLPAFREWEAEIGTRVDN